MSCWRCLSPFGDLFCQDLVELPPLSPEPEPPKVAEEEGEVEGEGVEAPEATEGTGEAAADGEGVEEVADGSRKVGYRAPAEGVSRGHSRSS